MKNNGKGIGKGWKKDVLRLIRTIFGFFPVLMPLVLIGILFNAIVGSIPAVFYAEGYCCGRTELAVW